MSRCKRVRAASPQLARAACLAICCLLLTAAPARAGVVTVENDAYSLDGGPAVTGAWEVAEKLAVARDVVVVVLGKNSRPSTVQTLLQLLENLHVPTAFTKKADYKALRERGVLVPTRTPTHP